MDFIHTKTQPYTQSVLPLSLQFFAEEGQGEAQASGTGGMEAAPMGEEKTGGAPAATHPARPKDDQQAAAAKAPALTALLEADKALQSQFDKLISKALTTAQAKWEKEKSMTAEQLAQAKAQEKAQELAEREQAILARELRAQAIGALSEKGLPTELVDAVACADEEGMHAHLEKVEGAFRAALNKAVAARLAGSPPPAGKAGGMGDAFQQKMDKYRRT